MHLHAVKASIMAILCYDRSHYVNFTVIGLRGENLYNEFELQHNGRFGSKPGILLHELKVYPVVIYDKRTAGARRS